MDKKVKIPATEFHFLDGSRSRGYEFRFSLIVWWQFLKGFRALHFVGPCVTIFGSARFKEGSVYYEKAREVASKVSSLGLTVMTGGGPGIMEAANRGAFENGGMSVGVSVVLPHEQVVNPYTHKSVTIRYFFIRKVLLLKYSYSFVVMPGGFGTMDELFETLTLVQTAIIKNFPVVLMGKEFHKDLITYFEKMAVEGTIHEDDLKLVLLTDDTEEAKEHIRYYLDKNYRFEKRPKPKWWLGEKTWTVKSKSS